MNENHDPNNGQFTSGGGGLNAGNAAVQKMADSAHKEHLRGMLKEVHNEHSALAAKLSAGTIDNAGLNRLDSINQFVQRNAPAIKTLK